jgi:NADPH-dependent glutamate synthase beta subunit-like oxidoreductase/ferredoxin
MSEHQCPVRSTIDQIERICQSNTLVNPKSRRFTEEILELLNDVAWGRAGGEHLPSIKALGEELAGHDTKPACVQVARLVEDAVTVHRETFESHVRTHNCATGECVKLAPAPCQMACPAGIDVPTYVTLIGMGHDAEAISVIRKDNPFPWVCGLVCTRPCEMMCVRGRMDEPVSIKFLKAFAAERAMSERSYRNPPKAPDKGKKVAIIGAGPAGMSAAYYLALKGYGVEVIEDLPMAGGMMMVGIPRYRLPREVIDREVAMIEALGIVFRFNTRFGRDETIESLKAAGFEAFFIAIGAHGSFRLNIPGEKDYPRVTDAISLLKQVALGDRSLPGRRVVVVGGGNVAIDAARTCLRLGCESVTIAYRRTRNEMPADIEEIEQAEEEGVEITFLTIPVAVEGEGGNVTGLRCLRAKLVVKEGSDRLYPKPVEGSEFVLPADAVIAAIGQQVQTECLQTVEGLQWSRRRTIGVDLACMQTDLPGVFAAGDAVTGPATVIEAIGGGKRAAEAIDRYLSGLPQPKMPPVPVRRARTPWIEMPAAEKAGRRRPAMPLLNIDRRRLMFQQVELGYSEEDVRREAGRCLRCDICRRCGLCVEICRDRMKIGALHFGYMDFDQPGPTDLKITEKKCILCGACAANCPNEAIRIEDRNGERILSLCGTILNRRPLIACVDCGAVIGTEAYIQHLNRKILAAGQTIDTVHRCAECRRKHQARLGVDLARL